MKSIIDGLDKAFNHKIRLGIMAVLVVNDWVDFNTLKKLMNLTDGNLASHLTALEKLSYLEIKKEFVSKKPKTSYKVSASGRKAFNAHLDALEKLINSGNQI